jgi:hypothetical protein
MLSLKLKDWSYPADRINALFAGLEPFSRNTQVKFSKAIAHYAFRYVHGVCRVQAFMQMQLGQCPAAAWVRV